jgi:hypothetical protein
MGFPVDDVECPACRGRLCYDLKNEPFGYKIYFHCENESYPSDGFSETCEWYTNKRDRISREDMDLESDASEYAKELVREYWG